MMAIMLIAVEITDITAEITAIVRVLSAQEAPYIICSLIHCALNTCSPFTSTIPGIFICSHLLLPPSVFAGWLLLIGGLVSIDAK